MGGRGGAKGRRRNLKSQTKIYLTTINILITIHNTHQFRSEENYG